MKNAWPLLATLLISLVFLSGCKKNDTPPITPATTTVPLFINIDLEQNPTANWGSYLYPPTSNPNHYQFAYSTEAAASGTHSLKISCDTIRNDTTFCYFSQFLKTSSVSITVGAKLTLKAKIKTVNLQGKGLSISMVGYKTNSTQNLTVFSPSTTIEASGNSDFKEYTLTLNSYPGNVDVITVYLFYQPKTTGIAYFDDISLSLN